jgi:hypothetical protein
MSLEQARVASKGQDHGGLLCEAVGLLVGHSETESKGSDAVEKDVLQV